MKKILLSALLGGFVLNNMYSDGSLYWLSNPNDESSDDSERGLFDLSDEYSDIDLNTDDVKEDYNLDRQQYILLSEISQSQDTGLEENFMDFLKYISKTRDDFFQRDFKNDPRFKFIHQLYKKGTEIAPELIPIINDDIDDNADVFCDYCNPVQLEQFGETPEQFQNDYIAENVGPFDINDQNNRQRFFTELTKAMDNIFPEEFSQNLRFKMVSHIFGSFVDESLAGEPLLSHGNLNKRSVNECYLSNYSHNSGYGAKFSVKKHTLKFFKNMVDSSRNKYSDVRVMPRKRRTKIGEVDIRQIFENFKNFLNTDFCKNELGYDSVLSLDHVMDTERYVITLFNSRSYLMWRPEYEDRYIFRLIDFFNKEDEVRSYYSWHYNIKSRYLYFFDGEGKLKEDIVYKYSTRGDEVFKMTDEEKFRYIKN